MEVAHFGRGIEVLVVNCACWDHQFDKFNTLSRGEWNTNGGDTKLSEFHVRIKVQHFSLISGFCQFLP